MNCQNRRRINLTGRTIVVTGATSGIGLATASLLAKSGAFVIGVGRSETRNNQAKTSILVENPKATIHYLLADLASQSQVRMLAKEVKDIVKKKGKNNLTCLLNNAGIYLENKRTTVDAIEETFATNHLAPFLLTHELLTFLVQSGNGRVITVSSCSHRITPLCLRCITNPWFYFGLLAYKRSKLCNVLFSNELNRKYGQNLMAIAVDPGLVDTSIASKGGLGVSEWVWRRRRKSGHSPNVPAEMLSYLSGSEDLDISKGFYYQNCLPMQPSKRAQDEKLARKLWALSCKLTNTDW